MAFYVSICVTFIAILLMSGCVFFTRESIPLLDAENCSENSETDGELIFVHVLYRHGDRTPVWSVKGSQYADLSYWPEGWGHLTRLGVQQEYSLGTWFRCRYNNFLGSEYNSEDIYVQSSDNDRTLMSAQSVLAGLYPPVEKQIWKRNIPWQPIPVHTVPSIMDYLIPTFVPTCPSYYNAMKQYLNSDVMKNYLKSIQSTLDHLTLNTGIEFSTVRDVALLRDAWICESSRNYKQPQWVNEFHPNNEVIERTAVEFYNHFSGTKLMAKFRVGFLLKDILDRFTSKIENSLTPNRKMWMYSAHDLNIFPLLRLLDVTDLVPYAGSLMFELRKHGNEHYVQIFYRNSDKKPEPIPIPGCGPACPLSKLYTIYDDIIPKKDFDTECLTPDA